jgi:hypothetical protein
MPLVAITVVCQPFTYAIFACKYSRREYLDFPAGKACAAARTADLRR